MNMVPYNQEVFDTYTDGDTFKVKLRCGLTETAQRIHDCLMIGPFEYYTFNGRYFSTKDGFIDIMEIEDKPKELKLGKTYLSTGSNKYKILSYDTVTKLYIAQSVFARYNDRSYRLFSKYGISVGVENIELMLNTESDY